MKPTEVVDQNWQLTDAEATLAPNLPTMREIDAQMIKALATPLPG